MSEVQKEVNEALPRRKARKTAARRGAQTRSESSLSMPVVLVAASAGGVQSLTQLFAELKPGLPCCFIVVQHLSPHFPTALPQILGRRSHYPIRFAEPGQSLEVGEAYLLPARQYMVLKEGRLCTLEHDNTLSSVFHPADALFKSLSNENCNRVMAAVLSGSGSDGRDGCLAVRKSGATIVVQRPDTCEFSGMPDAVIDAAPETVSLEINELARRIETFVCEEPKRGDARLHERSEHRRSDSWSRLSQLFKARYSIEIEEFKQSVFMGAVGSRMASLKIADLEVYVDRAVSRADEVTALMRLLLSQPLTSKDLVTLVEFAENTLWPLLTAEVRDFECLKLWVITVDRGIEALALGMSLSRYLTETNSRATFRLFCTSIGALSSPYTAKGEILPSDLQRLPVHLLDACCLTPDGREFVDPTLRSQLIFAEHNSLSDLPFSNVSCLFAVGSLKSLQARMRQKVISRLAFSARAGGRMIVASEESKSLPGGVETIGGNDRLQMLRVTSPQELSNDPYGVGGGLYANGVVSSPSLDRRVPTNKWGWAETGMREALVDEVVRHARLLTVVVNRELQVVQTFGTVDEVFRVPSSQLGMNFGSLLAPSSARLLETELTRIFSGGASGVLSVMVSLSEDSDSQRLKLYLRELSLRLEGAPLVAIEVRPELSEEESSVVEVPLPELQSRYSESVALCGQLKHELDELQAHLAHSTSQLEAANEELQTANEELLAGTEELQCTNEELESVNEELFSVNAENQDRVCSLVGKIETLKSALCAQDLLILVLNEALEIQEMIGPAVEEYGVQNRDIGRNIGTLAFFADHRVDRLADTALKSGVEQRQRLETAFGASCLVTATPFEGRAEGSSQGQSQEWTSSSPLMEAPKGGKPAKNVIVSLFLPRFVNQRREVNV